MDDEKRYGVERVIDLALDYIGNETPVHVSYDIDSLDLEWAPCTGFPVASGLSLDEGLVIARRLHQCENRVAIDLVEINPDIPTSQLDLTVNTGFELIKTALGVVDGS